MDDAIGQILNTLDDLKLASNTIVYFTSDHGADIGLGKRGGINAPFKGAMNPKFDKVHSMESNQK